MMTLQELKKDIEKSITNVEEICIGKVIFDFNLSNKLLESK